MKKLLILGLILALCVLSVPVAAAIAYQTSITNYNTGGSSLSITPPGGVASGNFLFAQIVIDEQIGTIATITAPSGWNLINRNDFIYDGNYYIGQATYWKVATSSEPASYSWSFSRSMNAMGGITRYTGVNTVNPIVASTSNSEYTTDVVADGLTGAANSELVALYAIHDNIDLATPSSMTGIYHPTRDFTSGSDMAIRAAYQAVGSGPTGDKTTTGSSPVSWVAQLVDLRATPTFTSISPASGSTAGGTSVTITGTGFNGVTGVTFGGTAATGISVSETSITATTPAHGAGAVDVVVTTTGGTATGTGVYTYSGPPTFTSISPAYGPTGGGTAVTIVGSNFISGGSFGVTIGGAAATSVVRVDSTHITAVTPARTAGARDVVITNNGGQTVTGTNAFTYVSSPTFTSISPEFGPTAGGTAVTIVGSNFISGDTFGVTFGGVAATGVSRTDATHLTAITPAHVSGPVNVVVTTSGGSASRTSAFTYVSAPTFTSISPSSGPIAGGTSVTISGSNFIYGDTFAITFGGVSATGVSRSSSTTLTATTPAHAAGPVDVIVTTSGGSVTGTGAYNYRAPPTWGSIAPPSGTSAGGTSVTITGTGFTGATGVTFGGTSGTSLSVGSDSSLTITTPSHSAGSVNVVVTTPGGTVTGTGAFTYIAVPTVTGRSPAFGPLAGGTSVAITGTGFNGVTAVNFGTTAAASYVYNSPTSITAVSPAGSAGTVNIRVITPGGTSATSSSNQYTYVAAPTFTSISPSIGSTAAGTDVTITGSNFISGDTFSVTFGGVAATGVSRDDSTHLTATTPAHAAGAVDVVVTTSGGSATRTGAFTYADIVPSQGPTAGGTAVTIYAPTDTFPSGTGTWTVDFGGAAATSVLRVNGVSGTQVTAITPLHAAGPVTVTVKRGSTTYRTLTGGFTYIAPAAPTFSSITPASGPTAGGTPVTIEGSNFVSGGSFGVTIGGVAATGISRTDSSHIAATTPAGSAGAKDVVITNNDGQTATGSGAYTYIAPTPAPTFSSITPASGPTGGGTPVTIEGSNFVSGGLFGVTIGDADAAGVFVDATHITATTPPGTAGAQDVVITNNDGQTATGSGAYTYVAPVPVAQFTADPASGLAPLAVHFTDKSAPCPNSWKWKCDSGSGWEVFSIEQNPSSSLSAGTHKILLETDTGGIISTSEIMTITVDPTAAPVPEFPTVALPAALIVGLLGAVLFIRKSQDE
jgi:hypothetical protein